MRSGFVSHVRNMTCEKYLKQPKSLCEIKLTEIIARNPKLINCFKKNSHPLITKHSHIPQVERQLC